MRNWYSLHQGFYPLQLLLRRTLPMRNWYNMQLRQWDHQKLQVSDITYEELIRLCQIFLMLSSWRRTLPMRNWYDIKLSTANIFAVDTFWSRTLPMRNWYEIESKINSVTGRSDITYEELIPNHGQCWTHHVLNLLSDITYEELIQSSTVYSEVNEASSDITYEELIPIITDILSPFLLSDITYEELIHHLMMVYSSLLQLLQSDITYEELIHFRQQQSHLPETLKKSRRTLPMRNWYGSECVKFF